MMMSEFAEKLNEWVDYYGWGDESLNDFANTYATSYEEYNAIWEILNELKKRGKPSLFILKFRLPGPPTV